MGRRAGVCTLAVVGYEMPDRFDSAPPSDALEVQRNHCGGFSLEPGISGDPAGSDGPSPLVRGDDMEDDD